MRQQLPACVLFAFGLVVRVQTEESQFELYPKSKILDNREIAIFDKELIIREQEIKNTPDVQLYFNPAAQEIDSTGYKFDFPLPENYVITLAMDPCKGLEYDCCMKKFGSPEYPALINNGLESERFAKYDVLGNDTEVQVNFQYVYNDGTLVPPTALRSPDDEAHIDPDCRARNVPYAYCAGYQYAYKRSTSRLACSDNNVTIDALAGCTAPDGTPGTGYCIQVGFSQNAYIPMCSTAECGTFLEVHMVGGYPGGSLKATDESYVISEARIENPNSSGMSTMTIPLTWNKDPRTVLCSYVEPYLRVGSTVYILPSAPLCCCMSPYDAVTRQGSFLCPIGGTGKGPYATDFKTLAEKLTVDQTMLIYPFCHTDLRGPDKVMCSVYSVHDRRNYTRNCTDVTFNQKYTTKPNLFSSPELQGAYQDVCPYDPGCASPGSFSEARNCQLQDFMYTFVGRVGKVTQVNNIDAIPKVSVTFNDGRTSYEFKQRDVQLEYRKKSMYELWWVVRTKSNRIVQLRKGFNVTNPACTFDTTFDRYFPYAMVDANGIPQTSA